MKKVIIIGSGIGGLIAGNLLAKKGHKVTIFESHSMPGGYTAGFYRKGFYFESGTLSFESSASVFKAMKDIGVFDKLEFVRQRLRFVSEEIDASPESYEDFKKMFYDGFPSEKARLDRFFAEIDKAAAAIGSMDKPMPFIYSGLPFVFSMLSMMAGGFKYMKIFKKYRDMTMSEFVEKYFEKGSKLYMIIKDLGYPDMAAYMIAGVAAGSFTDYWTVKTGMQSWADTLADNFKNFGGELKLNSRVDRIITKNGAAVGVSSRNTDYYADYVISAGDYKKTLLNLLDDKSLIPPDLQEKIKKSPVSEGFFTVYLGLNIPNEELKKHMKIPHVMSLDKNPDCDIFDSNDEEFFNKTSVSLYSQSMVNPALAPEGKSSLMIQTIVPYKWMQNWGGGDREKYKELKEKAMEILIDKVSKLIPNLRDCIGFKDAATPLTYERYTHNSDGASSAWSWNPKKKFYENGFSSKVDTPVKNLFIGSCWSNQIGGVPGALGAAYLCAKKIK